MKFSENDIRQITEETWKVFLRDELAPSIKPLAPQEIKNCIAASAQVTGEWPLAVILYCSTAMARHAAAVMFDMKEAAIATEDIHDVMRELVNVITGNVKAFLQGDNQLSLPSIVKGQDFKLIFPRHVVLAEQSFMCHGEPLLVMVMGEDKVEERLQKASSDARGN